MKARYRLFLRRKSVYYAFDNTSRKFQSLETKDRDEAERLVASMNEAGKQPAMNLRLARVYLQHSDPSFSSRTWQHVMDEAGRMKKAATETRWRCAMRQKGFDRIRHLVLIETRPEHLLAVMESGTVSTNVFLRRLHNYALDMNWLPAPVLVRKHWPKTRYQDKRGVTLEEHQKILAGERNPEWRAYYQMLWHTGGAQSDVANLCAENIDWNTKVISFNRRKTGTLVQLHFGPELESLISDLPGEGLLFPNISRMKESDRASLFSRRCRLVGVSGVSLHCYRYAWAERAKTAGYPERFAQEALGHSSKAVHRAYARGALVKIPSLEDYEKRAAERIAAAV
ncbi:MAG TPA: tyrosine-type recombinase/integrase [Verrucomicrobiota bacterium]|nr:tyrosine-type recombinase/integrase [Verrucomicrobiota bacterium]